MTETQLALLMGITYIAPHIRKDAAIFLGCIFLIVASIKGMLS